MFNNAINDILSEFFPTEKPYGVYINAVQNKPQRFLKFQIETTKRLCFACVQICVLRCLRLKKAKAKFVQDNCEVYD
jgi:hypothetical protein